MKVSRLVAAVVAVSCAAALSAFAQRRPNVVLLYADDLGYGDVSSYGATALKTQRAMRRTART